MKILFDMASVIQTGLRKKGPDGSIEGTEVNFEGGVEFVPSAMHGYENAVGFMIWALEKFNLHPSDMIMVFEGRDSKKRRMQIDSGYKGNRGKSAPEYYVEYNKCKDLVKKVFREVGALAVTQDFAEGDDTLKFFTKHLKEDCVVVSNDGDLSVLAGKTLSGHKVEVLAGSELNKLPEGVYEPRHVTLYKTLVGDSSDSIKGCPRFGPAKWTELLMKYGGDGLDEIADAIDKNNGNLLAEFAKQNNCKLLRMIVDNWNQVRTCWRLVMIYDEWVNTRYNPLKWEPGLVLGKGEDSRLHKFAQAARLVTAENYDQALAFMVAEVGRNPELPVAFDVETSSPEETADWFEQQGRSDGVDPLTSKLAGFSLTFGKGGRYTYYVSVNHHETPNVTMKQARLMLEAIKDQLKVIHNSYFELVVLYNDYAKDEDGYWRDLWKSHGESGMMPNIEDTLFMASYVDENAMSKGLKALSKNVLGYEQVDFNTMRTFPVQEDGSKPWPGGRVVTKVKKVLTFEADGVTPVLDSKGKQKLATVYREEFVFEDGVQQFKRVRNKETGLMEDVPKTKKVAVQYQEVQYSMHEMPASAVFAYGCDDTICTMAYRNFAKLHMEIDEHYHVYRMVEIDAAYQHAKSFYDGFVFSHSEMVAMRNEDNAVREEHERVLHEYLIEHGWFGTVQPKYTKDLTPAQVKEAYSIVFGIEEVDEENEDAEVDPVMALRVRTPSKIVEFIRNADRNGAEMFAYRLEKLYEGDEDQFNDYVGQFFDGKPKFVYSNKHLTRLLYEVMGCTVKVRNIPTPAMKAAGIREGNPKADALAIDYAIMEMKELGREREAAVLNSLKIITMVNTRFGLFYNTYPTFVHWKTGRIHSSHRQCHANTRRASSASPNMQQVSAHEKIEGFEPKIRRVYQPHKPGAVIVSMDFNAQELRLIADDSLDPNMLACYVGDNKKDMHAITGSMIALDKSPAMKELAAALGYKPSDDEIYALFQRLAEIEPKSYKEYRSFGKKVNFTALYGAMAAKVAATLMISEEDAQAFLDARAKAFAVSEEWKKHLAAKAKEVGFVRSRLGAKRHLAEMFDSTERGIASKAERQASNFRIQGSAAEMTKLAEGRMWRARLQDRYDYEVIGPIHDEVVVSVMLDQLFEFLPEMHACMVAPYADMKVEIKSSIEFGPNMHDLIEIGMEPTREAIAEGIEKLKELYPQYA